MKTETLSKIRLTLNTHDVEELLERDDFHYDMYWDYHDELDIKTLTECMPDENKYKREDGTINYHLFVSDRKASLEDKVWEWNIDYISEDIQRSLTKEVEEALKKKNFDYDILEFDFYPDELYSINLDMDYILGSSRIDWNVVRHNNFDGFDENEVYEHNQSVKQIVDLFPDLVDKNDLERACADGIYTGSDLKVNFRTSMLDFLNTIESGKVDLGGSYAVLHLGINGSGSPEFQLGTGIVELGKTYGTVYDRRDWSLDTSKYGVCAVYGGPINNNF